jgi:hypothetical protein
MFAGVDVKYYASTGTNNIVSVRMSLNKFAKDMELNPGDRFGVELNDDFSGLERHQFNCQGDRYITG